MKERWLPVVGYETEYDVSTKGRVRSRERWVRAKSESLRYVRARILAQNKSSGRPRVGLCHKGKMKWFSVYRLVLEAFVGPCPEGMEARHYPDRDTNNNSLDNLSWGTRSQNQQDRVFHGTDCRGEKHVGAKLTESDVKHIRRLYKTGRWTQQKLGNRFGVSRIRIGKIVRGKVWHHIL